MSEMAISDLMASYAGDVAWANFARAYGQNDQSIESVADAVVGEQAAAWLQGPLSALDGYSPNGIMGNYPSGHIAIRALLMRLP
ncbi:hypothetical protein K9B33_13465 [Sphingobium sp. 3R8]|uniref:hypothetical protein n=1 Tax=Sphingobium sp. 3R8 TaxID=2874921 RepID=UPI001CC9C314|nr:hypothetical protein [Sphingobium sp. 3R8]MBZ9648554.1 hypothetical protein [Sphingobium sp. 3R8]